MKIHDFAHQLELLAKFLRSLPNGELNASFQHELWTNGLMKNETTHKSSSEPAELPSDIDEQLRRLSPIEIEKYLWSETNKFTSAQLLTIAEKIGVSTSKRQSKNAIINAIARFFEARQMDMMIRGEQKDKR